MSMHIRSAFISDSDLPFLVLAVPQRVLDDQAEAEQTMRFFQSRSAGVPVALVTCDALGATTAYYGRGDLATRLLRTATTALRWQDFPM
jgi:hypothetical protein